MRAIRVDDELCWLYAAINTKSKLLSDVELFNRRGTDPALAFLHRLTQNHDLSEAVVVHHNNGQVEIDGLITTRRNGDPVLVVVEAKTGRQRALAKHKLFYPLMAVEAAAAESVTTVLPVYLRAQQSDQGIFYEIYECTPHSPAEEYARLCELRVESHSRYRMKIG